jgi:uncharacterized protein (TIGR00106 family)
MALMDIAVVPLDAAGTGLSAFVAGLQNVLASSGLSYRLQDMGTEVEGTADELFAVARQLHEHCFQEGVRRVYTVIKIDDRRDRDVHIGEKEAAVKARLAIQD